MTRAHIARLLSIAASVGVLLPAIAVAQDRPARKYALVIGVHKYAADQPLDPLPFTENDAGKLAGVLEAAGYKVTLLTQQVAFDQRDRRLLPETKEITRELEAILNAPFLDEQDTVLIALAGHGGEVKVIDENDNTKTIHKFCFLPGDADLAALRKLTDDKKIPTLDDVRRRYNFIPLDDIYGPLGKCAAGTRVVLVDACRNDPTKSGIHRTASDTLPIIPPPPGGLATLMSCSQGQRAVEDKDLQHGVFFHFVIKGLQGEADFTKDGNVTLTELTEYVGGNTFDYVRDKYKGARQIPELQGTDRRSVLIRKADTLVRDLLTNSLGMKLKLIPAGEFLMGSPLSETNRGSDEGKDGPHRVRITNPFHLGIHEVTVGQFRAFVNDSGYKTDAEKDGRGGYGFNLSTGKFEGRDPKYNWRSTGFPQTDDHPVVNVTWNDADAFCKWLSRKEGKMYRLPTEAQWEYACRAGTTTAYNGGRDDEDSLQLIANIADASFKSKYADGTYAKPWNDGYPFTAPAGSFKPNAFGLYDMHGNVWEWCEDWYDANFYATAAAQQPNPVNLSEASYRVDRGGSWYASARGCRSADRGFSSPDSRSSPLGFRVAAVQSQ